VKNYDLIVGALKANPVTVGIFGYSFLMKNLERIQGVGVNGVVSVWCPGSKTRSQPSSAKTPGETAATWRKRD
jgi:hypothetical protein